jgi:N-acetylglutamate synthase-like GNAT family acetyltransferase
MQVHISQSKSELDNIIQLRYDILRKPWNKPIESVTDEHESTAINAYVKDDNKIIGCGRLQLNTKELAQIRFMAVADLHQGKGIGKYIVLKLEDDAKRLGVQKIELHARKNAVEFYKSLGYEVVSESYKLWDTIQHYLMIKNITE